MSGKPGKKSAKKRRKTNNARGPKKGAKAAKRKGPRTTPWMKRFLDNYDHHRHTTNACKATGIDRATLGNLVKDNPDFRDAYYSMMHSTVDDIDDAMKSRCRTGYLEPVFYKGKIIGSIRKWPEESCRFMLKAHKRDIYVVEKDTPALDAEAAATRAMQFFLALQETVPHEEKPAARTGTESGATSVGGTAGNGTG